MAALIVVFAVVTVVIGTMIFGSMHDSIGTTGGDKNNTAAASLTSGEDALGNITDWADIITLVIAAAVIIGVLGLMRLGGGGL